MTTFENFGFEFGDGTGTPKAWSVTTLADREIAAFKRAENKLDYSEELGNPWWTQDGLVPNGSDEGPFGDPTDPAVVLREDTSTGQHELRRLSVVMGARVTQSIYAKANGRDILVIRGFNPEGEVFFDLNDGEVLAIHTNWQALNPVTEVEDLGDGWYRCSVTRDTQSPGATHCIFGTAPDATSSSYTGNGANALILFGAQFEDAAAPSHYVRTTGSTRVDYKAVEDYESYWSDNEGYLTSVTDGPGIEAAEYDVAAVSPVEYESYEEEWSNTGYITELSGTAAAEYLVGENLLTWSEAFDDTDWTKVGCSIDDDSAGVPTGFTGQSDRLQEDASTGEHRVEQAVTTTTTTISISAYINGLDRDWAWLEVDDGTNYAQAFFDVDSGTVGTINTGGAASGETGTIENAGGGFWRCTLQVNNIPAGSVTCRIGAASADDVPTYAGNASYFSFAFIGAQLLDTLAGVSDAYYATEETSGIFRLDEERYEQQWGNEPLYSDWDDIPYKVAALYDATPEAYEDYEEGWGNDTWVTPPFGVADVTDATYDVEDGGFPEDWEDYEEYWPSMATI